MRKINIAEAEEVVLAIQDEIRRSDEARYDHRLHALLLIAQGMSCNKAAVLLGDAPRTVAYWVRRFEAEGFSGLVDGDRPGRPKRLNESQLEDIAAVLRKDTSNVGLEGPWDGKALSTFIQQQWGISLGVRQCQRLFRQLGFRLRKPRPKIAQADSERQEQYKKTSSLTEG
jgi:transposase